MFNELVELQTLEKLNPHNDNQSGKTFLDNFDWSDTILTLFERQKVEELLVEFHDIFDRHSFDIGTIKEFKVKLNPNDDRPAFSQKPPNSDQPKRRHQGRTRLTSQVWYINHSPFLHKCQPCFCATKTYWQATTVSGSAEKK